MHVTDRHPITIVPPENQMVLFNEYKHGVLGMHFLFIITKVLKCTTPSIK